MPHPERHQIRCAGASRHAAFLATERLCCLRFGLEGHLPSRRKKRLTDLFDCAPLIPCGVETGRFISQRRLSTSRVSASECASPPGARHLVERAICRGRITEEEVRLPHRLIVVEQRRRRPRRLSTRRTRRRPGAEKAASASRHLERAAARTLGSSEQSARHMATPLRACGPLRNRGLLRRRLRVHVAIRLTPRR